MKLMFASDIHGSAAGCRSMFKAWEREKPEKLVLLGDLLYHGPRNDLPEEYHPKEVIRMLNSHKEDLLCVRGNCEAEVDQMVLEFPVLADYCILYLGGQMVFVTHGHLFSEQEPPLLGKRDILLTGHTHIWAARKCGDWYYLNPGSVSLPKEGRSATYLIWEEGEYSVREMDGRVVERFFTMENRI